MESIEPPLKTEWTKPLAAVPCTSITRCLKCHFGSASVVISASGETQVLSVQKRLKINRQNAK